MSKGILDRIGHAFRAQAPFWACEFTTRHCIVAGVDRRRSRIAGRVSADLKPGCIEASLAGANIRSDTVRPIVREALNKASFHGSEIGVVIPDEAARIAFLSADNLPKDPKEQLAFIRWKLRKTVPFDVDSAQIAFRVLGPHKGTAAKSGVDLGIVMSPRAVVQEYEKLMESLELHAGLVIPSTLAALNIYTPPAEDALFVKVAPDCVTTTVFQGGRMTFYRRVGEASLYDAVYPTILYYQDKLGGSEIRHLTVCGYPDGAGDGVGSLKPPLRELEEKLKVPARPLGTRNVEDIFKPALGTVQMTWQSSN